MIAQCAADSGRTWFSVLRTDAEFSKCAEATGLIGNAHMKNNKFERQGDANELIDTGRVSKMFRDGALNFGKDLLSMYDTLQSGKPLRKTMYYHTSACNVVQAYDMLSEKEGAHSLALRDRCLFIPCPIVSPYDDPPAGYLAPESVKALICELREDKSVNRMKRDKSKQWTRS